MGNIRNINTEAENYFGLWGYVFIENYPSMILPWSLQGKFLHSIKWNHRKIPSMHLLPIISLKEWIEFYIKHKSVESAIGKYCLYSQMK
jgi:hypothetical protein